LPFEQASFTSAVNGRGRFPILPTTPKPAWRMVVCSGAKLPGQRCWCAIRWPWCVTKPEMPMTRARGFWCRC